MKNEEGLEKLKIEEKEKIKMLQNIVTTMYNQKIRIDKDKGTMEVNLTVGEIKELVALESDLIELKRRLL